MNIILPVQTEETLVSVVVEDYPAGTAISGSPFSGGSLTNMGNGLWSVAIGSVTGNWYVVGFNADGNPDGQLIYGYASSDYVDGNGDAVLFDFPPWQQTSLLSSTSPAGFAGGTIEIKQGDSYDGTANDKKSWTVTKDFTGWTGKFRIRHRITNTLLIEATATAINATTVEVGLSVTDTEFFGLLVDAKEFGPHPYDIEFTSGSNRETCTRGIAVIYRLTPDALPASSHRHFGGTIT